MSTGKIVLGVLAGIATGATLGVLFAPDKGSSTRKKIIQKRDAYVDEMGQKVHELVDNVTKKFDAVKRQAAHMVESGEARMEALETDLQSAGNAKMR